MKKLNFLFLFTIILLWSSCTSEEKYQSSLIQDFELTLNGDTWKLNTGITNLPLFVYKSDGDFVANYSTHYRFTLDNGTYYFFATPNPVDMVPDSTRTLNLDQLKIQQPLKADKEVQISSAMKLAVPLKENLKFEMLNKTGILRLKAKDLTADKSYTKIRATLTVKRTAYNVKDGSFDESTLDLIRTKTTATGGVNYTDDFLVFETSNTQNGVKYKLELLNDSDRIVRSFVNDTIYQIFPDSVTQSNFYLNQ